MNDYQRLKAYQEFLPSIDWTFMCVFSTDYSLSPNSARRLMLRLKSRLIKLYSLQEDEILIYWVAEEFKAKDGCHLHALMQITNTVIKISVSDINEVYQIVSAARKQKKVFMTDIQLYNPKLLGAKYCAKDLYKKTTAYDFI